MMRALLFGMALAVAGLPAASGLAQESPVVVELFTSEGCSSCPPADAFLTDLARQRRDVLALAFHVTYWDYLGWKDPFSLPAATARQQAYAGWLGEHQVYTPQMVVDGTSAFVGSDRAEGLAQIARAARDRVARVPLRLTRAGQALVVSVGQAAGQAQVMLVGFDAEHATQVGRGENGGRRLVESNIVRSLTVAGRWTGAAAEFRPPLPAGENFAVLLQADDGRIVAATRLDAPAL
jgi:hypothetical protein